MLHKIQTFLNKCPE